MLSSIHPFGERSRHNSFRSTATAHILGSTLGGVGLGALAGSVGLALTAAFAPNDTTRSAIVLCAAVIALFIEATGRIQQLPSRTRQVLSLIHI